MVVGSEASLGNGRSSLGHSQRGPPLVCLSYTAQSRQSGLDQMDFGPGKGHQREKKEGGGRSGGGGSSGHILSGDID